jgi:hypothetical protein
VFMLQDLSASHNLSLHMGVKHSTKQHTTNPRVVEGVRERLVLTNAMRPPSLTKRTA